MPDPSPSFPAPRVELNIPCEDVASPKKVLDLAAIHRQLEDRLIPVVGVCEDGRIDVTVPLTAEQLQIVKEVWEAAHAV